MLQTHGTMPTKELLEFVRKLSTEIRSEGKAERFELWHAEGDGGGGVRLSLYAMDDRNEDEDADELCQEIWDDAIAHSASLPEGSTQRYSLNVFWRGDPLPAKTRPFILQGSCISSLVGSTFPPTEKGITAQNLQQNDNLHAMVIQLCQSTAVQLAGDLKEARKEIKDLYSANRSMFELEQKLLDRSAERELKAEADRESRAHIQAMWGMVMQFGPMLLGQLAQTFMMRQASMTPGNGNGGPPPSMSPPPNAPPAPPAPPVPMAASPMAADPLDAVRGFINTLDPSQIQGIAQHLTPDQALRLVELYRSLRSGGGASGHPPTGEDEHEQAH